MPRDPGTGLERATKSIPLSGGMTEEVDDFLLEPGGMQYMENLRFTKTDVAEKARGRSTGIATGVTNYVPKAIGLWSQGDTVAVVGNDSIGISRDGGDTYSTSAQDTDLLGIESVLRTAEQAGGNNYSWAPVGNWTAGSPASYDLYGYVVAFERVTHNPGSITNTRQVLVQIYDLEGRLLEENTLSSSRGAPKVNPVDGGCVVGTVLTNGDISSYLITSSLTLGSPVNTTARGVQDYCQMYDDTEEEWGNGGSFNDFNLMRLGYSQDLLDNNYAFDAFHRMESAWGVQGWKDGSGNIKIVRTLLGIPSGTIKTVQADSSTLFGQLLDVSADDTYIYVLYSQTLNATGLSAHAHIYLQRMLLDTTGATTKELQADQTGTYVNGSCRPCSNGDVYCAWTFASGKPTQNQLDSNGAHHIGWQQIDSNMSTVNLAGNIFSYRMCSDIAIDQSNHANICAQQWENWNVGAGGEAPLDLDIPVFTPTHKKPVTTILVKLTDGTENALLLGTFDAGQSKCVFPGSDEQSMHMNGELYYFSAQSTGVGAHQFWYGNCVLLGAADTAYFATITTDRPNPSSDGRMSMHPGSTRFSCYHLSPELQINTASLNTGMMMGAAVPTWYDGSYQLCSMQPTDSPEIIYATDSTGDPGAPHNAVSYMLYQDAVVADNGAKVYQAVTGYYDDAGLVHRSAPSQEVYIGKTIAGDTTGTRLTFYVTAIVGMARDRKYFVEIYEALPGGVPQLAATTHTSWNDGTTVTVVRLGVNASPKVDVDLDVIDTRSARTIYTAGNVLAADPWPNFDLVVASGRRLFAHSISDPATIFYSKTFESGVAPEFSASLAVSIGNEQITAMGAIDDKVIIFSDTGCWVMYGTGPDNTGANGDFFIERMVFPIGCTDQQSIITMQDGIAFYSSSTKEFHLLTRDLQIVDIGEAVKVISENITDVVESIVVPRPHEVRWYCTRTQGSEYVADSATDAPAQPPRPFIENQAPTGAIFVYNYKYKKWSINEDSGSRTQRAVMIDGNVGELAEDWDVYREDDSSWGRLPKWETPWIKVNQLQDFGRFYGLTFLGKYLSSWSGTPTEAGDLQVTIHYDYEGPLGATDVHRFRANVDFDPADGDRLQFRVRPKRQKCQAIKIKIEEVATTAVEVWEPTYTTGQGYILTAVDIHYGAKGGSGDKSLGAARRKG